MMVADFFTKPLQGALFKKLKAINMSEVGVAITFLDMSSGPKERVRKGASEVLVAPYG
jgi:hypothetical protein